MAVPALITRVLNLLASGCGLAMLAAPVWSEATPMPLNPAQRQILQTEAEAAARREAAAVPGVSRVRVEVGEPDARLRLAPCARVEAHWPAGARAWGRTRVGLRCIEGPSPWNIYVPVTVQVFAKAPVLGTPVGPGTALQASDLVTADVDLAADRSPAVRDAASLVGRELNRPLARGDVIREQHLKSRQWFAAGDTVRVLARGDGFVVIGSGQALNPGVEGQATRIRTDNGRIITGTATGERTVELLL
jgi:flagellar basal body P-ring formation protein FlgA